MVRRLDTERTEIDVWYAQYIYPNRNTLFGTSDPDKLSWEQQVDLGKKRFPDLNPPFTFADINAAYLRRIHRAKNPHPKNMV